MDVPIFLERGIDIPHNVARNRESDSFAAARLRKDEGVDSNEQTTRVYQRPAAISGIDRSIRLYIDARIILSKLTCDGAHDTHTDGIVHSKRASKRQYELALFEFQGITERNGRKSSGVDLQ